MTYSSYYLRRGKKTIQILGVFAAVSIMTALLLFTDQTSKKNGWQETKGIEKIIIANRSPHGFDVMWTTTKETKDDQWVEVGTSKGSYPIRGNVEKVGNVYYSPVAGLTANTKYFFRIRSGSKTYKLPSLLSDVIVTPNEVKEKPVTPAYGKVVTANSRPYADGLIVYEIDGYYPLATFTKQTGEWLIPLTGLVEKKTNSVTTLADKTPVVIKLFSYPEGSVRTILSQTRPLRQVILAGKRIQLAKAPRQNGESVLGATSETSVQTPSIVARIIYPKENAVIPGNAPLIRGTAPPGKDVVVLIQGVKQYSYRTKADEKGDWLVQAPVVLGFGHYTITVTIQSGIGATTIVKRSFSIIKSGEQVLGEATGSSTLTPSPTVAPVSASPTPSPTVVVVPTVVPTSMLITPTAIIPTRFVPTATPPVTGGGVSAYLFGALVFIVVGAGLVLAF